MTLDEMKALPEDAQKALFKRLDEVRAAGKSTNYACLPTDNTDVLTKNGWVCGSDVKVGDYVLAYNSVSGKNEWSVVSDTFFYDGAHVEKWGHTNWQVESTLDHRWIGQELKQVGSTKKEHTKFWVDSETTTQTFKQTFNIRNTAPYVGGVSDVQPHEAALVAWLLADGYYKWSDKSDRTSCSGGKKKGLVASIAQASHKYQDEVRDVLLANNMPYQEDSLQSSNENSVTSFRLKSEAARNFLDRVVGCRLGKHGVDWVKWVLNLSQPSLQQFAHHFWLADGDSKDNAHKRHMVYKQNRGNIADALLVVGYLLGFNVTQRGFGKVSVIRYQKDRCHTTCQRFIKLGERVADVFCLTTDLGNFVIRQNGIITITGNCQYGAGVKTVARTAKVSERVAKQLHSGYHKLNWSIAKIASLMKVKQTDFGEWQYNPISKLWYSLRSEKDRFSTLIQGSGAYVLDLWLYHCSVLAKKRGLDFRLLGQFHDELILECPVDEQDEYKNLVGDALEKVNETLKLNRDLGCDINFGEKYSDIH